MDRGFCLALGLFGFVLRPLPDLGDKRSISLLPGYLGSRSLSLLRLRPRSLAYVLQATGLGMPRPRAA